MKRGAGGNIARVAGVVVRPLHTGDWPLLEALFGERGACAGCWCMAWRLDKARWEAGRGASNRRALRRLVRTGAAYGSLAIADGRAVGWCSTGPRADFVALERKPSLATDWDARTWSVTCFFVDREWRRRGLGKRLLEEAVSVARAHGATRVEGYPAPLPQGGGDLPAVFAWTGLPQVFRRAGFRPLKRVPRKRPIWVRRLRAARA